MRGRGGEGGDLLLRHCEVSVGSEVFEPFQDRVYLSVRGSFTWNRLGHAVTYWVSFLLGSSRPRFLGQHQCMSTIVE